MYACWPYRLVGITQPDTLQLARDTWETVPADRARLCKQDYSWMANVANMAALAWPEEAKKRAIYKMANTAAPQARFPAFFGPGHDWLPDHNWGGAGMIGIQEMLLAPEPRPARETPSFPRRGRRSGTWISNCTRRAQRLWKRCCAVENLFPSTSLRSRAPRML